MELKRLLPSYSSHPSLPQMVGYSNDETPTPFILLANGSFVAGIINSIDSSGDDYSANTTSASFAIGLPEESVFGSMRSASPPIREFFLATYHKSVYLI